VTAAEDRAYFRPVSGDMATPGKAVPLGWLRITTFAGGDFAFNLYWQSLSLYLLFYYTDAVGLSAATAGLIYMVASIWDGMIDPVVGAVADRTRTRWGGYRPYILFGAAPLGLAFCALYFRPPVGGLALIAIVLAAHLVFRSLYAVVNVPYAALTARITRSASERATISGMRMLFATGASIAVALTTEPLAVAVTGRANGAAGFFVAAACFAVIATLILPVVAATTRERIAVPAKPIPMAARRYWRSLLRNRAFWTLVLGGGFMIACATALGKSVLYYFKYSLHDEAGARTALALAGGSGLLIVPAWLLLSKRVSKRAIWLASSLIYAAGLIAFALIDVRAAWQMDLFLVYMQIGTLGLAFAYWGMLPDTVEYGEWRTGVRAEAFIFGLALLFQKVSLGLGAGLFGLALGFIGYRANQIQSPATLHGLKTIMVALPLFGVAVCALAMVFNPLKRGMHERIVEDLSNGVGEA
jgi:GPH family glycoside/pentoside/hexuronide:cation symporter